MDVQSDIVINFQTIKLSPRSVPFLISNTQILFYFISHLFNAIWEVLEKGNGNLAGR